LSLADVILSRRSVRSYEQRKVPDEVLGKILEAGRQAPSADNMQPWHFIVVTDSGIKEKLSNDSEQFTKESAFTVVGCRYIGDSYSRKWSVVDTTIALQNMVIAAWSFGIGSCWIGSFNEEEVNKLLSIPDAWKVIALISFGYPAEKPGTKLKKPLTEIVGFNKF
jgi:nitroreductase